MNRITNYELRITIFAVFAIIVLFTIHDSLFIIPAYAAEDIGESRITPASPLYFLKSIREILELKFAGTTHVRSVRELEFATRRIREANSLVKTSREDLIEPTLARYLSHLGELKGITNLKDENMATQVSEGITRHMNTLQTIYDQVSNPRARMSIRATINRLSEWEEELIDKLNLLQSPLARQVLTSKLSGCNFLSKEASSSALNEVERAVLSERAKKCLTPSR